MAYDQLRLRRHVPTGGGRLRLVMLVTLGMVAASCTSGSPNRGESAPPVLGQQRRTPEVVGQPALETNAQFDAVSCATSERCWAVGTAGPAAVTSSTTSGAPSADPVIDATVNGGRTWVAQSLTLSASPTISGISCPGARRCMAVGSSGTGPSTGLVLTTDNGGVTWSQASTPGGAIVVTSVECTAAADCTAIADDGTTFWSATSTDFGRSWQREGDLPAGLEDPGELWCSGVDGPCLVTGFTPTTTGHGQGAIATSSDGGATWTAAQVPAGTGLLQSAVCANGAICVAGGTTSTTLSALVPAAATLLRSTDGGLIWTSDPTTPSIGDIYGIDCPSSLVCVVVGTDWVGAPAVGTGAVAHSSDGGSSFTASATEYTPLALTAVACPTSGNCVAVGGDTLVRITLPVPPARSVSESETPSSGVR